MLLPITIGSPVVAFLAALAVGRRPPRGKGVFVRDVRHGGTPEKMAATCRALGLAWVTIALAWQYENAPTKFYHVDEIPAYASALRSAGIRVRLWAWPVPGKAAELTSAYRWVAARVRLEGFDLNPEAPYQGAKLSTAHADLDRLQTLGVPLSCVSYGAPISWHPRFPWEAWARCDVGMPELYDTGHKWGSDHQEATAVSWTRAGFRELAPVWGASDAHSPDQMRTEIEQTAAGFRDAGVRLRAGSWWDFYWLERSSRRSAVVAGYKMPDTFRTSEAVA